MSVPRPPSRRVAVFTGSRSLSEKYRRGVQTILRELVKEKAIILVGCANGLDKMVREYLAQVAYGRVEVHTADWGNLGRKAGHKRNGDMIDSAVELAIKNDVRIECYAYPAGVSPGTRDCMRRAKEAGATIYQGTP